MATLRSMPVLQVRDVARSVAFYEKLGFASHGVWGDPPLFAIIQRGDVTLALDRARQDGPIPLNQWWAAYIYVDDAKALRDEFATLDLPSSPRCISRTTTAASISTWSIPTGTASRSANRCTPCRDRA